KAAVLKTARGGSLSWVRIPLPPPFHAPVDPAFAGVTAGRPAGILPHAALSRWNRGILPMSFTSLPRPVAPVLRTALAGAVLACLSATASAQSLHTGVWWDPAESGWGLMVTDQGNVLAPYWYAPDVDGEPTWFLAPATPQPDG